MGIVECVVKRVTVSLKRFSCFHLRGRVDQSWDVEEFSSLPRIIMNPS